MRFATLLLVLALVISTTAVFANGISTEPTEPGTGPATEPVQPVEPTQPGTGPGMQPTQPGMMPVMIISPEVEVFNLSLVTTGFNVDRQSVIGLRQAGWSWGDIHLLANIAAQTNRPILEIANWRSQGLAYTEIAKKYNITTVALLTPQLVQTRVAGFVTEYGFQPLYYRTDPWGNPVLTRFEAERLTRMGYDWRNIAVATNIAAETGASVRDVLSWVDRGYTWQQVALGYGVNIDSALNVDQYPFSRNGASVTTTGPTTTTPPVGTGPMTPGTGPTTPGMDPMMSPGMGGMTPGMTIPNPPMTPNY